MSDILFYAEGSKSVGPLSLADLRTILSLVSTPGEVLVWRDGFPNWERAENVEELAVRSMQLRAESPSGVAPATVAAVPSVTTEARSQDGSAGVNTIRTANFIAKNWRGEYPLWISYWVFGVLANIAAAVIVILVPIVLTPKTGYNPISVVSTLVTIWLFVGSTVIWQLVGIWRSATRYIARRKRRVWGVLAKLAVIVSTVRVIAVFAQSGYPQIEEAARIAFLGDPGIPDYTLRIIKAGTEIEIFGGFKFGLNDDLVRILKAAPQARVVHLNSTGGRLGEAEKLYETIKERSLITYTSRRCLSACTLAFVAGRERWIYASAQLGFHAPTFPGASEEDLRDHTRNQRTLMLEAGVAPDFIDRALSTPNASIWQPREE